jgi:type I restriction enzyme R subunit
MSFSESIVERAGLAWRESIGWYVRDRAKIAPGESAVERDDYGQAILVPRLRDARARLNPAPPPEALDETGHELPRCNPNGVQPEVCTPANQSNQGHTGFKKADGTGGAHA